MGRAPCCDKNKVKRGPWSPEEDALLKTYIHAHGTGGNWIALPTKAGLNRCGKSCRLRWMNYLRPDIKHGGFTDEEDCVIYTLYLAIGSRWSVIASKLPGRTDNDVKNYWNTKLKKKIMAGKVRGFEPRSTTYNTCYSNNLPQPSSTGQLAEVKQEHMSFDHVPGLVPSCEISRNYEEKYWEISEGISNRKMSSVYSSSGSSSYESGHGFPQKEEGDPDDFWLRLLLEQSTTFMEGSSSHQDMNEIVPVFDLPDYF